MKHARLHCYFSTKFLQVMENVVLLYVKIPFVSLHQLFIMCLLLHFLDAEAVT